MQILFLNINNLNLYKTFLDKPKKKNFNFILEKKYLSKIFKKKYKFCLCAEDLINKKVQSSIKYKNFNADIKILCKNKILFQVHESNYFYKTSKKKFKENISYYLKIYHEYFKSQQIKKIIFFETPYHFWDYMLYETAKLNNIKTLIFFRTPFSNFYFMSKNVEKKEILDFGKKIKDIEIEESKELKLTKKINKRIINKKTTSYKYHEKELKNFLNFSKVPKNKIKKFSIQYKKKINKIKQFYELHAISKIPKNKKNVTFFLNCSPGRTTEPEAGIFANQILAIKKILQILPKDYNFFIKEHPSQFNNNITSLKQLKFRNINFYKKLKKLKRINFLSNSIESKKIILSNQINISINGSPIWESVKNNKKTICFVNPYFFKSKNLLQFNNTSDMYKKLKKFLKLSNDNNLVIEKLFKFNNNIRIGKKIVTKKSIEENWLQIKKLQTL